MGIGDQTQVLLEDRPFTSEPFLQSLVLTERNGSAKSKVNYWATERFGILTKFS